MTKKYNEQNIGRARLTEEPRKRLFFRLAPGCITPEHLSESVRDQWLQPTLDQLSKDIRDKLVLDNYYTKEEVDSLFPAGAVREIVFNDSHYSPTEGVITIESNGITEETDPVFSASPANSLVTSATLNAIGHIAQDKSVPTVGAMVEYVKQYSPSLTGVVRIISINGNIYRPSTNNNDLGLVRLGDNFLTKSSLAASITQDDIDNWNSKTDNIGTLAVIRCGAHKVVEPHDGFLETSEFLPNIKLNGTEYGITQDAAGNNIYDLGIITSVQDVWKLTPIVISNIVTGNNHAQEYEDVTVMCVTNGSNGNVYLITSDGGIRDLPYMYATTDDGVAWISFSPLNSEGTNYYPEDIVSDYHLQGIRSFADFRYLVAGEIISTLTK